MKKTIITFAAAATMSLAAHAQFFGFGGQQIKVEDMHSSQKFADINYAGDDQAYHTLDVYLPEKKADKYPVVIHIYGSAWMSNNSKGAADLGTICAALLKAGYAVVTPNHRSIQDAQWPAQSHDIKAVIRWVRGNASKYNFDPDFVATSGFSSGGHLSSFMGATSGSKKGRVGQEVVDFEGNLGAYTEYSSEVQASVDWSGPIDLLNMDCGPAMNMGDNPPERALLGGPKKSEQPDKYRTLSPISFLDHDDPGIIVFHGKKDNVVPFCQGEEFARELKAAGITTEFYPVEEGGHGVNMYSDENLAHMVAFLDRARTAASAPQEAAPAAQSAQKPAAQKKAAVQKKATVVKKQTPARRPTVVSRKKK